MPTRCVALFSGGLDSMLAVRLMQEQGIQVEALHFKTIFTCCQDDAGQAASKLGLRLTVLTQEDDYLELVRRPSFGYGKGANPCVDCRIYMFRRAKQFLQHFGAQFVVSGEVLGQRPMSQKRRDLEAIAYHSDLEHLLLRPLSAQRLPPTWPERAALVDRRRLYDFTGRSRKPLIQLARRLGIDEIPSPSTGCSLTEPQFGRKVHDLVRLDAHSQRWDFELLKVGRHFRYDADTKVVVGRDEQDNLALRYAFDQPAATRAWLMTPEGFPGPHALVVGPWTSAAVGFAGGLILRYSRGRHLREAQVRLERRGRSSVIRIEPSAAAQQARTLASVPSRPKRKKPRVSTPLA